MKKQLNIYSNELRENKLEYSEPKRLTLKENEPKEFLTKSGQIMIVVKRKSKVSGVGMSQYFQATINGSVYEPLTSKGILHWIRTK